MAAHYTHGCRSPTVRTATPDAVARKFNHPAIDLNRPPLDDPMDDHDPNSSVSDCKSVVSADQSGTPPLLFNGSMLVQLSEGHKVHRLIKEDFSRLAALGMQVTLAAIHANCYFDVSAKARYRAFQVYSEAVQKKGGDNTANVKCAWYAASKEEVFKILSNGFGYSGRPENNGLYGCGVYFAPYSYPLESVISAPTDEDGLRHLLLCRVILGKSELVSPGSEQSHPSSEEYDMAGNGLSFSMRLRIWSSHLNTRVLPVYIVSFRFPSCSREGEDSKARANTKIKGNSKGLVTD
ncbi:hypothetical protein NL676_030442 [Syzygium grande]|nr:hypothetical protein NL676_030442 [Syzygium grande]